MGPCGVNLQRPPGSPGGVKVPCSFISLVVRRTLEGGQVLRSGDSGFLHGKPFPIHSFHCGLYPLSYFFRFKCFLPWNYLGVEAQRLPAVPGWFLGQRELTDPLGVQGPSRGLGTTASSLGWWWGCWFCFKQLSGGRTVCVGCSSIRPRAWGPECVSIMLSETALHTLVPGPA